jgi:hypothetical protein
MGYINEIMKIQVRIKADRLEELRSRYNTNTLGKILNNDTAQKLLKDGDANITMRNFYKLCKAMDWPFHDYLEAEEI